ncbi:non-ribosomal peptide synthetase, partial [Nonomuraea sp. PA05]|uniref:condensation domain-containing protein n=1 Tax=Nonomuraea sp. PA05 TaxID=2604466 RepID=UPI0011D5D346
MAEPMAAHAVRRPVTHAQERTLISHGLLPHAYERFNGYYAWRFTGPVDGRALRGALECLAGRHEALRTRFEWGSAGPVQVVEPVVPVEVETVDLRDRDPAVADAVRHERAERPFDLSRAPLFRCTLILLDGGVSVLVLVVHHLVCDGWSIEVLCRELCEAYEGRASGLPPAGMRPGEFAAWQRGLDHGDGLAYWTERLAGVTPLALPTPYARPPAPTGRGAKTRRLLSPAVRAALRDVARAHHASVFMVGAAALHAVLARYANTGDTTIGTPVANRTHPDTDATVGFLANTIVLRADTSADPTFTGLL